MGIITYTLGGFLLALALGIGIYVGIEIGVRWGIRMGREDERRYIEAWREKSDRERI